MAERAAIILAAGKGTRMKSALPKVLHPVAGRAMIDWSIDLAERAGCSRIVAVLGPDAPELHAHVASRLGEDAIAIQDPPLGTGHAVLAAKDALIGFQGDVVVLYGDTPLAPVSALEDLFSALDGGAAVGVLGFEAAEPGAYGRLVQGPGGDLERIVEARDATPEELSISFCNSGVVAADADRLFDLLSRVGNDNAKGEYYLTDIVGLARAQGGLVRVAACDEHDVMGVNSRAELAQCEAAFQARRRAEVMEAGVTLVAPDTVHFAYDTHIEPDVVIEPYVVFGPGVRIASGAHVRGFCHIEHARIDAGADLGPFTRIRGGSDIEPGARVGTFVEMKATRMGAGAKANHLAYLGDGDVGAGANIGAGVIFCNYDGFNKHKTAVGEGAFIGSNSALVAPVSVGDRAYIGSGSVITEPVEADALALGRGRQIAKPGWSITYRARMTKGEG